MSTDAPHANKYKETDVTWIAVATIVLSFGAAIAIFSNSLVQKKTSTSTRAAVKAMDDNVCKRDPFVDGFSYTSKDDYCKFAPLGLISCEDKGYAYYLDYNATYNYDCGGGGVCCRASYILSGSKYQGMDNIDMLGNVRCQTKGSDSDYCAQTCNSGDEKKGVDCALKGKGSNEGGVKTIVRGSCCGKPGSALSPTSVPTVVPTSNAKPSQGVTDTDCGIRHIDCTKTWKVVYTKDKSGNQTVVTSDTYKIKNSEGLVQTPSRCIKTSAADSTSSTVYRCALALNTNLKSNKKCDGSVFSYGAVLATGESVSTFSTDNKNACYVMDMTKNLSQYTDDAGVAFCPVSEFNVNAAGCKKLATPKK